MSQFNIDTIKSSTGNHGPIIVGVTTVNGNLHVGSGVTVYSSSGIVSATKFFGDGSALDNITTYTPIITIGVRTGTAVTFTSTGSSFNVVDRSGSNVPINV